MPVRAAANHAALQIGAVMPDVVAVEHQAGAPHGVDAERLRRTLVGFASNPNVGEAIVIGVTGDDDWLADALREAGTPVSFLSLAACGGIQAAVERGVVAAREALVRVCDAHRVPMSSGELVVGLECGGSDALSGITANPALGVASDLLVRDGGTSILAETPELIGAEERLAARAASPEVGEAVRKTILDFERAIADLGVDVRGAQPTPGNQAGGLTTIEEKSLGAAKKGGNAQIVAVLDYAERPTLRGLHIMDTPGQDIEQMVGMAAGGCQVIAFTTGRGTPTGCPIAPCLKISTNTRTFERMTGDMDLDAGVILEGVETVRTMGERIYEALVRVAAGEPTASERRGNREFAISRTSFLDRV
jgi:altronate dehydratase large subunit